MDKLNGSDKLTKIKARLQAPCSCQIVQFQKFTTDPLQPRTAIPVHASYELVRCDLHTHAPTDLAYLLARLEAAERVCEAGQDILPILNSMESYDLCDCPPEGHICGKPAFSRTVSALDATLTTWQQQREGG